MEHLSVFGDAGAATYSHGKAMHTILKKNWVRANY